MVKNTIASLVSVVEFTQPMAKVNVLGVEIDPLTLEQVLADIFASVAQDRRFLIAHANLTGLNLAYEQDWLRAFYNHCDLVYCDGMGVMLGAHWLGYRIPERYTLADWAWLLAERAAQQGASLYLLGGPSGVAQATAEKLRRRYPSLNIAGTQHGFFDKTYGGPENQAVVDRINAAHPDILLVGFGMPLQERWLAENWPSLNAKAAITCGALFEYLSGGLRRGPRWMTQSYLEWLARLLISPRRYARRYLRDLPLFVCRVVKQKFQIRSL
jgi:N-acetylglucosaminyldiphosphoundecaprenol N-acetyl-beta-D-mannosaminyltransferase